MQTENISTIIEEKATRYGHKLALCQRSGDPSERYTYAELNAASGRLAAGLVAKGLQPGDRVAILSESRPRWGVVFFAAVRAGAIVVPLDIRQTRDNLAASIADARPSVLVCSKDCEQLAIGLSDTVACETLSLESAAAAGRFASIDENGADGPYPCVPRSAMDPAVLSYTSGTLGPSKGVLTSFGNLLFEIRAFRAVLHNDTHCRTVSILPLSHLFELTAGFLGVLYGGGRVCYVNSLLPQEITAAMRDQQVTCMATVPLFLTLLANGIRREIDRRPFWQKLVCRSGLRVSAALPFALRRRLFRRLHAEFGGKLEYLISGGAPLDLTTLNFFEAIGLPVYQGYGLAETSPVIATNAPGANRDGSVGRPLPGVEVRIAADGEILTRGPHVMLGYFNNADLTQQFIDRDGWLHTGDLGRLDRRGYLYVSGRKKNLIVLASGKKVQPETLEPILCTHPDIEEGCVIGVAGQRGLLRGSEEVCVVAVPSRAALERCAARHEDPAELIRGIVEQLARNIAPAERPTRVVVRNEPLPRTATRKVRRGDLTEWLRDREMTA